METRKTIILNEDYGDAKKGSVFIRGDLSHGVPEYHKIRGKNDPKKWYWREGYDKSENRFISAAAIKNN